MNRTIRQARSQATQFRATETDGKKYIEGYFSVFCGVYELWPGATESVDPKAFDDTINDDIRALINHDTTLVLGRNQAGTLELKVDEKGLWGRVEINEKDQDAMNLYARVERNDVNQCSFGFDILEEDTEYRDDGSVHWTLKRVKLYEVSVVTFPAYEDTSVQARKKDFEQIKKRQIEKWKSERKERLKRWH
jgi:HK97 family phage prohead protease